LVEKIKEAGITKPKKITKLIKNSEGDEDVLEKLI